MTESLLERKKEGKEKEMKTQRMMKQIKNGADVLNVVNV